jgi:hypothetical protein
MSAPRQATAGVAFWLTTGPICTVEADHQARAAWWAAHVDLLRWLLAAQPEGGYPKHATHLVVLKRSEDWLRYLRGEASSPLCEERILREDMEAVLADFGPPGHRFGEHPNYRGLCGWWPCLDDSPFVALSGREAAARIKLERHVAMLAEYEAALPSLVEGTSALPSAKPSTARR